MTDFTHVLLTDNLAMELFRLAAREHLLYSSDADCDLPPPRRRMLSQRTLSLLVLFDKVIIHDFSQGVFRIPDLENAGVAEVIARGSPSSTVEPLKTRWKLGPLKNRKRPPKSLLKSLRLFKEERALVIARLLSVKSDWERSIAQALGISRRQFLDAFFDYALACVEGDQKVLLDSILNRLPDDILEEMTACLYDFQRKDELLDEVNAKLVFAIAFADEVRVIQELSSQLGVGVATEHYHSKFRPPLPSADARSLVNHFVVLRTVLAEDRGVLPRIRNIRHALALRRDPNLRSLRKVLVEFNTAVQQGNTNELALARREVARAKRAMKRRESWQRRLDWVSYFSLPIGVAEGLTGAPPIAGLSLAVLGATGTAAMSAANRRHGWVFFNL